MYRYLRIRAPDIRKFFQVRRRIVAEEEYSLLIFPGASLGRSVNVDARHTWAPGDLGSMGNAKA